MYQVGNVYVIAAVAVVGGALFGFDINSMAAIISTKPYLCYFNQGPLTLENDGKCSGPTADVQGEYLDCVLIEKNYANLLHLGGITAAMPGGSWLGAIISGYLSDILGRKRAIQIGAIIWCIGSIIVCAAQNIPRLIVGRIIMDYLSVYALLKYLRTSPKLHPLPSVVVWSADNNVCPFPHLSTA